MRFFLALCMVACCGLVSPANAELRKWTARTGNFSAEAELVDVKEGNVVLKKADGTIVTVPLDHLSLADVRYVETYLRDATAAVGKPVEDAGAGAKTGNADKASGPPAKSGDDRGP